MFKLLWSGVILAISAFMHQPKTFYDFSANNIDGKSVSMAAYKGKVVLVVNTASQCGFTPQYEGLQKLYMKYKDKGLVIIAFPANDFRSQEPGSNSDIKQFCTSKYGVTFPLFEKVHVIGENRTPMFQWLVENSDKPDNDVEWNFAKFLVGRDGTERARFAPKETPESRFLIQKIEQLLAEKAPTTRR